ncbi:MAG: RNA polymerase sigma factor [Bacteroidota bacterium]
MTEENDSVFVKQCLEGNTRAFESIVEKYQKTVFNVAFKIINDREDAEDIAQSSFVKAFEKLDTFNPKYKFFSWLYRIVVNESLNVLNQRKRLEGLDGRIISKEKTPEESYEDLETSENVEHALMDLAPDYRIVIVLKHFQNLSYRDIGHILEIPEKTVKSRLFTARQLLRNILLKKGIGR